MDSLCSLGYMNPGLRVASLVLKAPGPTGIGKITNVYTLRWRQSRTSLTSTIRLAEK